MTHVQNVHACGELKGLCTGYGGEYNPGKQNLQVEALNTLWLNANQVKDDVIVAKAEYDIATNNREQAFAQLGKLSTRIFGILKAGGASPVRLQATTDLYFEPYAQEEWVRLQAYAQADWSDLVELWARDNLHVARIMDLMPDPVRSLPRNHHRPLGHTYAALPADGIPTLEWLMRDYVAHL